MARGIGLAWLVGVGLVVWREGQQAGWNRPVPAGRIGAASGLFVALGLLSEWQRAAPVAVLIAWGFDLAVLLAPGVLPGTATPAQRAAGAGGILPTPTGQPAPSLTSPAGAGANA